jgi:hypothetical protein
MRDVDMETVTGNMRIVYIEKRAEMYEGDMETVTRNMRIVYTEKRAEMYEGCRL